MTAAAGVAVSGCTADQPRRRRQAEPAPEEPQVDPDVTVAAEALANQREMLDLLAATRKRHRRLSRRLAPVVAAHEAHEALLAEAVPKGLSASPTTSPSPSPDGSARTRVPRNRARALDLVAQRERELTTATKRHAFSAESGAFARLLGSMAAAAAQHATTLSEGSAG